jgi:hypothetical protein
MSCEYCGGVGAVRVRIREYCIDHDLFMSTDAGLRLAEPNIDKMARISGLGHTTLIPFLRFPGRRAAISFDTLARICALLELPARGHPPLRTPRPGST